LAYAPNRSPTTALIPELHCLTAHKAETQTKIKLGKAAYIKSLQNIQK